MMDFQYLNEAVIFTKKLDYEIKLLTLLDHQSNITSNNNTWTECG
jgi:hypothetical protein